MNIKLTKKAERRSQRRSGRRDERGVVYRDPFFENPEAVEDDYRRFQRPRD